MLKKVWKDGTRALLLEPEDLVVRLIATVPPPGFHLLRYFGVLSSHSRLRSEVVPCPPSEPAQTRPPPASGDQLELLDEDTAESAERARRKRWAWLLAHVFRADVDTCPHCDGPMR